MKTLLGCLMCLVLTMAQGFAISGGPFGGSTMVDVRGTYAGVFVPIVDPTIGLQDNSLALFTLTVPRTGLASGTAAIFRQGFFYPGTIQGSADPDSAKVTGIIQGTFTDTVESGLITAMHNYFASGKFQNTKIVSISNSLNSSSSTRIRGMAEITYVPGAGFTPDPRGDSGGPIRYRVHGFKQSDVSS
jgi:hypothetical protein